MFWPVWKQFVLVVRFNETIKTNSWWYLFHSIITISVIVNCVYGIIDGHNVSQTYNHLHLFKSILIILLLSLIKVIRKKNFFLLLQSMNCSHWVNLTINLFPLSINWFTHWLAFTESIRNHHLNHNHNQHNHQKKCYLLTINR